MGNKIKAISKTSSKVIINMDIVIGVLDDTEISSLHHIMNKLNDWDDRHGDMTSSEDGSNYTHELAIPHIERAVGYKLHDHQIKYLVSNSPLSTGRGVGKTTAYCIKLALSKGKPLDLRTPEDFSDGWTLPNHLQYARSHFKNEFMRIRLLLKEYGFRVRDVRS